MTISELPKTLSLDKNKKKQFWDELVKNELSPFKGMDYLDVFVYALAIGYSKSLHEKLKQKEGTIPERTVRERKEVFSFMKAIAVVENGIETLVDGKEIANITEEYANGGIKLLYDKVFKSGTADPIKILESEAIEQLQKIRIRSK